MSRWLFVMTLLGAGGACAMELTCPAQVTVTTQAREVPAGWEAFNSPEPHTFDRVAIYYLHPREMGSQVPDNEGAKAPRNWVFAGKSDAYWLACEYQGTETRLTRRLPSGLTRCEASGQGVHCR